MSHIGDGFNKVSLIDIMRRYALKAIPSSYTSRIVMLFYNREGDKNGIYRDFIFL